MSKKKILEAILLALSVLLTAAQNSTAKETAPGSNNELGPHLD